jgi:hypothetical protein
LTITPARTSQNATAPAAQPVGVVAGGNEQGSGVVGANAAAGQQVGSVVGEGGGDLLVQLADLVGECLDASCQESQGVGGGAGGVLRCVDVQLRATTDQP